MGFFDDETAVHARGDGRWTTHLSSEWDIAGNSNGGYMLVPVLRAMRSLASRHPDPLTVTTHFLRPGMGSHDAEIEAEIVKSGRLTSVLRASMSQSGSLRLIAMATFGDLTMRTGPEASITVEPPDIPSPQRCLMRDGAAQGVDLAILNRVESRLHPDFANAGTMSEARVDGWIRFVDPTEPCTLSLPLFADAFPPSIFATHGQIGWVPTLEFTVQVRRRPAAGWLQIANRTDDISGGRLIESGMIWDRDNALVARMRQLAVLI